MNTPSPTETELAQAKKAMEAMLERVRAAVLRELAEWMRGTT